MMLNLSGWVTKIATRGVLHPLNANAHEEYQSALWLLQLQGNEHIEGIENCKGETERLVIDKGAAANILETEGEETLRNEQVLGWLTGITG